MRAPISFQPPRKLRVFAFDPATGNRHANRSIREMTISVPWELDPVPAERRFIGPDGEYLHVVDYDPASGAFYTPIDLNAPEVLYNDGLTPSEENPKFHQQMVYAVAMDTIATFEQALGRVILWSPAPFDRDRPGIEDRYVGQLRIYPHALREANAFYDPQKKALLFGYFAAPASSRSAPPGTIVFTCLSHDIIVHETCHAILDGMHPQFVENSNPDMLALHEAFADIVAIFQHFSHPEVLEDQIARTRGDLERQSLLGALAQEFGQAVGHAGALRDALGHVVNGVWRPHAPDNTILDRATGPHARGAILVAAVFRAFLSIYRSRVADLFRIASSGSGILREGEVDPDLIRRLAQEAAKSARHILRMCIRAMDYVPPVNVTFGDYLRAIVTADHDLFPEDDQSYRLAIIEAFTAWGIVPRDMPVVTEAALLWPLLRDATEDQIKAMEELESDFGVLIARPDAVLDQFRGESISEASGAIMSRLESLRNRIGERLQASFETATSAGSSRHASTRLTDDQILQRNLLGSEFAHDREIAFLARQFYSQLFWGIVTRQKNPLLLSMIGINLGAVPATIGRSEVNGLPKIWVSSVRMARRIGKREQTESEYVVEIIQTRKGYFDPEIQKAADSGDRPALEQIWRAKYGAKPIRSDFIYRAGSTLLIDTKSFEIRRIIRTKYRADEDAGLDRMRRHLLRAGQGALNAFDGPGALKGTNAFAMLHRHAERRRF